MRKIWNGFLVFLRLLVICLLGFALTFSSNVQDPPLMSYKVHRLAPDLPNTALGFLGFVGLLVAMVVQPIIGVFSDRAQTRLGKRLPFIIGGAVLIAASLFLLAAAPTMGVLLVGVILIQFSSNILQGPWQALIPDLVPESLRGKASSIKAVFDIIALLAGSMAAGKFLGEAGQARWGDSAPYMAAAVPTVIFILFVIITAIWAREKPGQEPEAVSTRSVGEALKKAFSVNFREHPIFGFWFANRILFWGSFIAINAFLINYLQDVIGMSESGAQDFYANLKIILGGALAGLAIVAGLLSDRFGRKPVMMVAGFVSFIGTVMLLFVRDTTLISIGGGVVGMGIGAFITASWALATDIVPHGDAARYLGIANIATCIGSGVARLLGGVLIDPINNLLGSKSSGYLLLYGLAALCFLASSLVIIPLPAKKVQNPE
jgi:MFS family permease